MTCLVVKSYHGFVSPIKVQYDAIQVCQFKSFSFFYTTVECIIYFHIHVHLLSQMSFASVDVWTLCTVTKVVTTKQDATCMRSADYTGPSGNIEDGFWMDFCCVSIIILYVHYKQTKLSIL